MTGLRLADTNIVLYSIGKDSSKKEAARPLAAARSAQRTGSMVR
ncbi:hypothetical protein [Candidatus Electronema sp. JM]